MSYPFEIPIVLELGNFTLTTGFGKMLQKDALKWRLKLMSWIGLDKVSIFPFFQHFKGYFKGVHYDSERPPHKMFKNNMSCKPFVTFAQKTLINRLRTGAISFSRQGWGGGATPCCTTINR